MMNVTPATPDGNVLHIDREHVVDKLKDSAIDKLNNSPSDIRLLLSAATSSQANKARCILEKYAPGQQTIKESR